MKILTGFSFDPALQCVWKPGGLAVESARLLTSGRPFFSGLRSARFSADVLSSSNFRTSSCPGAERIALDRGRGKDFGAVSLNVSGSVPKEDEHEEEEEVGNPDQLERRLVSGERVLQISKADFTVSSVLDKIRRGRLDLRPSYQRDYVWDKRTASKLIESVLLNIPLPTMFFHERSQGLLEVVDGKQRLTSIWCFMEDQRFPDGSDFALTGLEVLDELNGKKYTDLEESLREVMQDFALNVHTISRHSDDEVVFEVFERLNMGSTQLNEQELRNCVFQGRYNDLLEELVLHPDMLRAFRQEIPHKRMRDREFILRFFAMRRSGIENFYLPVKNWLNNEMRRHQFLEEEDFKVMKFDFQRCIRLSVNVFGDQVFRLPRGLKYDSDPNVCLWDTIMFGFLRYRDDASVLSKKKLLVLALNDLLIYNTEFKSNLVSTPKALKLRTTKWLLVLRELLGPS
ncbi:hypothetical protein MPTK1_5g12430 [Marchantia polymorpha subsp. ruderalis]|uniref:GmrSD restriction endonucleases N-terminal domain-containing protein n=2 Tax=Marchantia polymorpha TaxID=3197 RepID=A0A176WQT5_MARPO|nr:hypothetical protein AXG93_593s1170 [Marchantia polymorpha subsp. ruderalis]PTQ33102.1 hypothetical protein MARPO_0092s0063 [Marchantia polymorpha]BBN11498.1 hypothetical protein Mp_5g12430 [Marchantia polymorpha subsp. ruderalis]|eukprot:PTQ33102.1 hypothetical protein MARPO_0092s0063 [Marchantia polymorpha]